MNPADFMKSLTPFVLEAGQRIMRIYKSVPTFELKNDGSPVTQADKESEDIIALGLRKIAPNIEVISEENVLSHGKRPAERFFLVDPLDGTKEFIKKNGEGNFTINIALIENGSPIMGIVYAPALKKYFHGCISHGAWELSNGSDKRIHTSPHISNKIVAVASRSHIDKKTKQWLTDNKVKETISIGSSLKFCLVANGEADVYPRFSPTMEWDTAAGDAILRSAGGIVKTANDTDFVYGKKKYLNGPFIAWGKTTSTPLTS